MIFLSVKGQIKQKVVCPAHHFRSAQHTSLFGVPMKSGFYGTFNGIFNAPPQNPRKIKLSFSLCKFPSVFSKSKY